MKKYIGFILFSGLLAIGIATVLYAKANSAYTVQNNTNYNIGNVTLNLQTGNPVIINITGNGSFNADISSDIVSVSINNQTTNSGTHGTVTTVNGDQIHYSVLAATTVINN